jgi:hypothetical protein
MATKKERKDKAKGKEADITEAHDVANFKGLFSQLKDQYYNPEGTQKSALHSIQESFGSADLGDVTQLFQRLNKKSDATKLKSFKSLQEILEKKPEEFFTCFLTSWAV